MADSHQRRPSSSLSSPSSRSSLDSRPTPQRANSHNMRLSPSPSPGHAHRPSFTEQLRGMPPSPRQQRHLSLSQVQVQDLLNNPPTASQSDPKFAGRDWQHISVGELVNPEDVHFVEFETGIEDATNVGGMAMSEIETASADTDHSNSQTQAYLSFSSGRANPNNQLLAPSTTVIWRNICSLLLAN